MLRFALSHLPDPPQPSSATGRFSLSWDSEQDLHLGLSGVLFTCEEFLEIVEDLMILEFSAYHLDVDFRTAYLRCLSEVDILMVRSEHPSVITVAGGSSQKQGQKEEIAEYINPFVNSIRLVQ